MAMAKFVAFMLVAMFAVSMLQSTLVLASETQANLDGGRSYGQGALRSYRDHEYHLGLPFITNAPTNAQEGAGKLVITIKHACSFVRSAAQSVCVCPQALMETKLCVLATITGRPRGVDQNALEQSHYLSWFSVYLLPFY
ncbi:hypothetical protein IFM89_031302 [Coptis chinensis]|uniref:Uncharacterized protein n=1 Tax=Coptis chinensis TaxID=261450 RepID=A0A835IYL4_9MAGN|nr:hypothetical protein IFM89_031302 [Coptis chinensis]